tara:strand:- start:131 stop:331 length:201 start_codon:yes stop_codon:yes gene_type:complete
MTAFMLACYLGGAAQGTIYFRSINDCIYYTKYLNEQKYKDETGKTIIYECICKLIPRVNEKKVRVY